MSSAWMFSLLLISWLTLAGSAWGASGQEPPPQPVVRVVLLVPADLAAQFDARAFAEAVQLYATGSTIASVVVSNLPESKLLTAEQASRVGQAFGGRAVVWPTAEGPGELVLHVVDLEALSGQPASLPLSLPSAMDRAFYRLAALKLQSQLRSLLSRPPTEPRAAAVALSPPQLAAPQQPPPAQTAPWRPIAEIGVFGSLGGMASAGAELGAGFGRAGWRLGLGLGYAGHGTSASAEGEGSWTSAGARAWVRRRLLGREDPGALALTAEVAAGGQWVYAFARWAPTRVPHEEVVFLPALGAGLLASWQLSTADALCLQVGATLFPVDTRISLDRTDLVRSGRLAPRAGLAWSRGF